MSSNTTVVSSSMSDNSSITPSSTESSVTPTLSSSSTSASPTSSDTSVSPSASSTVVPPPPPSSSPSPTNPLPSSSNPPPASNTGTPPVTNSSGPISPTSSVFNSTLATPSATVSTSALVFTSDGQLQTSIVEVTRTLSAGSIVTTTAAVQSSGGSKSNTGAIAGGVVGGVALLGLILALLFYLRKRKRDRELTEFDGNFDPARVVSGSGAATLPDMSAAGLAASGVITDRPGSEALDDDGMGGRLDGTRVTPFVSGFHPHQNLNPGTAMSNAPSSYYATSASNHAGVGGGGGYDSHSVGSTRSTHPGGYSDPFYAGPTYTAYAGNNSPGRPTSPGVTATSGSVYSGSDGVVPLMGTGMHAVNAHAGPASNSSSGGVIPSQKEREAMMERNARRVANPDGQYSPTQAGFSGNRNSGVIVHQDGGRLVEEDPEERMEIPPTYDSLPRA